MPGWKTLSSKLLHKTPWIELIEDKVLNQNGKELTYTYLNMPHPSVAIVAVNDKGEILLEKVYRYTLKKTLWEIPAGHSDGEDLLVAAKRELAEEAELASDQWTNLGVLHPSVGVSSIEQYVFVAQNVTPLHSQLDEDEDITNRQFIPTNEVKRMLKENEIVCALTEIGLYRYFSMIEEGGK